MSTALLITASIIAYLGFSFAVVWVSRALRKEGKLTFVIFIPILISFLIGMSMMYLAIVNI